MLKFLVVYRMRTAGGIGDVLMIGDTGRIGDAGWIRIAGVNRE